MMNLTHILLLKRNYRMSHGLQSLQVRGGTNVTDVVVCVAVITKDVDKDMKMVISPFCSLAVATKFHH